jgi:methylenetetrahydrofolate dehydrogenase (NADP+) / methenyltetrahydrofolate cyclohydrolase
MPAKLIDGKKLADKILKEVENKAAKLDHKPGLAAILIGDNPASKMYLKLKEKACHKAGIDFHSYLLDSDCTEDKILHVIDFLNKDPEINGVLIQIPLPENFNTDKIIRAIDPAKDIDGFQPQSKFISPNILGIIELIKSTETGLKNKKITILSNSKVFAEPFKTLLKESNINYLDSKSKKLNLKDSDILIVAIGKSKFVKPEMIKKDAILIDVGINKLKNKTVGDIDPSCDKVASWRSPVPGGVGPMTVAMLLKNLLK